MIVLYGIKDRRASRQIDGERAVDRDHLPIPGDHVGRVRVDEADDDVDDALLAWARQARVMATAACDPDGRLRAAQ